MYVLITTDCSFTGCETKHLVKVNSTADLEQIVDGYVADDIQADGSYEILSAEDAARYEDDGYELEVLSVEDDEDEEDEEED